MDFITQNQVAEWEFHSDTAYTDPFFDLELDVVFTAETGQTLHVPAFWAGDSTWRVRFASPETGSYRFVTVCSDPANTSLHGQTGRVEVVPYEGNNPLFCHGPIRVRPGSRHFEHHDGTPFFWLADTWWMGLCRRISWPGNFQALAKDRAQKGFSVIQLVAGLYPDMPPFDERGANEAGQPWETSFAGIRPAYFDLADRRIAYLTECGLVPCIVGCWGFYLDFMGEEKVRRHWRYLVARYGAYPVMWCLAGESLMPYYLHPLFNNRPAYEPAIRAGWTRIARQIRDTDPFHRPLTNHPIYESYGRRELDDPDALDFDMTQAGHGGWTHLPGILSTLRRALDAEPKVPAFTAEAVYEGLGEGNREEIQRLCFWASVLSGAKGHTYGANGLWQANSTESPHGASPQGVCYGGLPALDAAQLPGSRQVGLAKSLLERYPWWRFEPHPEWIEHGTPPEVYASDVAPYYVPVCGGIPGEVRMIYGFMAWHLAPLIRVKGLEPGIEWSAYYVNPANGERTPLGSIVPDEEGNWTPPMPPLVGDFVLVLETTSGHV